MKRWTAWIALIAHATLLASCQSSGPREASLSDPALTSADEFVQLRAIASDDGEENLEEELEEQGASVETLDRAVLRTQRGEPFEYDAGPDVGTSVGRRYAEIFAKTPNYRALGRALLAEKRGDRSDKFRWQFGPMFYRGRLGENQVKVLIIGQEGAQDENVSDRAFTGGTGGRMQHMLSHLGIDRSYLFVNTFVYTIQGQYADYAPMIVNDRLVWRNLLTPNMYRLAQDPRSPIVAHRHELLDHILEANRDSLKMIIAVGGAAQDSLATYIRSKGGECQTTVSDPQDIQLVKYGSKSAGGNRRDFFPVDRSGRPLLAPGERPDAATAEKILRQAVRLKSGPHRNGLQELGQTGYRLETCRAQGRSGTLMGLTGIDRDIRFLGVQHPGSNSPALQSKFTAALTKVRSWTRQGWRLDPDKGMSQPFDSGFRYTHKPVPKRDFRFGLPDVIGLGQTSTTRRDAGVAIEFGSRDGGSYPRSADAYTPSADYSNPSRPGGPFKLFDVPNEPTKTEFTVFDPGPGEKWARVFTKNLPWDQLLKANRSAAPRFGAGVFYRGRLEGVEVIVLADQSSHDDMWVGRALMGLEGQRLQAFLQGIGAGSRYLILRTLPVNTLGADPRNIQQLLDLSRSWRNEVLAEVLAANPGVKMILTLGPQAEEEIRTSGVKGVPIISLTGQDGYKKAFGAIRSVPGWAQGDRRISFETRPIPIAREDIPYGLRRWTGTSGDRVLAAGGQNKGQLYKIVAPDWATRGPAAEPKALPAQELRFVQQFRFNPEEL